MFQRLVSTKLAKHALKLTFGGVTGYYIGENVASLCLLKGTSMEPTISDNNVVIVEKYKSTLKRWSDYKCGDIVIVHAENIPSIPPAESLICKRLAALPGDSVQTGYFSRTVIPSGHIWLLGDNAWNSTDSRTFGALPIERIYGRVVCKIWPLPMHGFESLKSGC